MYAARESPIFSPARPSDATERCSALSGTSQNCCTGRAGPASAQFCGTIFGSGEGYAGFLDTTTHGIVRSKAAKVSAVGFSAR
jgi:hypothetical protein